MTFFKENTEYVKKFDISIGNTVTRFYLDISTPLKEITQLKKELKNFIVVLESTFA